MVNKLIKTNTIHFYDIDTDSHIIMLLLYVFPVNVLQH